MMPTIAFILERVENRELASEQAWELVERVFRRHWHPDIGFDTAAPEFDAATDYALRQVRGFHRMFNSSEKDLAFIRRDFLAAHQRFSQEHGAQLKLSQAQAERALKGLRESRMDFLQPVDAKDD